MADGTAQGSWIVPVSALLVATIAVTTAHLIVAGLLPQVAAEFGVDIPTAGLLITGYSIGLAILSPIVALSTGDVPRKRMLIVVMAVFILGNALSAVASGYWMLLGTRIVVACCHGLLLGLATVLAMRLAPEGRKTSAVSIVIAGGTITAIAGLPLGTAIGNAFGWRASFWVIAAAGVAAMAIVALLVPAARVRDDRKSNPIAEIRAALRPAVLIWYAVFGFNIMGVFVVFAYIVPLMTEVSGIAIDTVPWVLFGMGIAGFFGNLIGGRLGDWRSTATIVGLVAGCIIAFLGLAQVTSGAWPTAIALCAVWLIGFGLPAPLRARILKEARDGSNLASMLSSTFSNFGIAAGAAVGGAAIAAGWSYGQLPLIAAGCCGAALAVSLLGAALERRASSAAAVPDGPPAS